MSTSGIVGEAYLLIVSIIVLAGFSTVYYSSYSSIGEAVRMEALEARERVEKKLVIAAVNYDAGRGVLEVYLKRVVEAGGQARGRWDWEAGGGSEPLLGSSEGDGAAQAAARREALLASPSASTPCLRGGGCSRRPGPCSRA